MAGEFTSTTTLKNNLLNGTGVAASCTYLALHSGVPNAGNELSGGSPAYARKAATWGAVSAGQIALSATANFDVPSGADVNYVACWNASGLGAGTLMGYWNPTDQHYSAQGVYAWSTGSISLTDV